MRHDATAETAGGPVIGTSPDPKQPVVLAEQLRELDAFHGWERRRANVFSEKHAAYAQIVAQATREAGY
jgi:hypothetical protein